MDSFKIAGTRLQAEIKAHGAELCSLKDGKGREYLWQAGPEWRRHAPHLFPIVGRLKNDVLRHAGREYRLTQHGFARDRVFSWAERNNSNCSLYLVDDEETRAIYPFPFRFEIMFEAGDNKLTVTYNVMNTGREELPVSFGAHPAFRWPLVEGLMKESHSLLFSKTENGPVRRLSGGLLLPQSFGNPVKDHILVLDEELFAADALIFEKSSSRSVRYGAPGACSLKCPGMMIFATWASGPSRGQIFFALNHGMAWPAPRTLTANSSTSPA